MCIGNERRGICDLLIGVSGLARPRYHGIQRGDMLVLELWILPYRNSPRRIRMAGNLGHLSSRGGRGSGASLRGLRVTKLQHYTTH